MRQTVRYRRRRVEVNTRHDRKTFVPNGRLSWFERILKWTVCLQQPSRGVGVMDVIVEELLVRSVLAGWSVNEARQDRGPSFKLLVCAGNFPL